MADGDHSFDTRSPKGNLSDKRQSAMLASAFLWCHMVLLLAVVSALMCAGGRAGANTAIAGAITMAFFATGLAIQLIAIEMAGFLGLGITVLSFVGRAGILGLLVVGVRDRGVEVWMQPWAIMLGVLAAAGGWIGGMIRSDARGCWPTFDAPLS